MSTKKSSNRWWWGVAIVLLGTAAWGTAGGWFSGKAVVKLRGQKVARGSMDISVVQRGNLAARDSASIKSEIEGQSTVLFLIKEGSFVKEGDVVVELDGSAILEKKLQQEIALQNADAAYKKAKAQYDIQESQNKSDIEAAERKLSFARIDLTKYIEGDLKQQMETADQKITLAKEEQFQAVDTFTWSQNLSEKGFLTKSELKRDELSKSRADVSLTQSERAKEILVKYEDPRKRAELDANVKEAERGLERAGLKAEAQIADVDANLKSSEAKLSLEREKLEKYVTQLSKIKMRAPTNGMVVYSRQEGGGGRMGGDQPMQEGSQVRERQEILQIPREGGMIVEASIHESVLKQVAVGKPCSIQVDAQPGKDFFGRVVFVALLPDKASWWANPNLRLYKTEIQIERPAPGSEEALKELRPGMSCSISILSDQVDDALQVPLQSIFVDKGESIAFVTQRDEHERRVVQVGRSNEKFVEVLSGLKEGEEVLMSAPPGFAPSGAEDTKNGAERGARGPGGPGATADAAAQAGMLPGAAGDPAGAGPGAGPGEAGGAASEGGERTGPPGAGTPGARRMGGGQRGQRDGTGAPGGRRNREGQAGTEAGAPRERPADEPAPKPTGGDAKDASADGAVPKQTAGDLKTLPAANGKSSDKGDGKQR